MTKSDKERIKKIITLWESLKNQISEHNITKELLLDDEFSQWAVTTPLYNIGEQVYKISTETKMNMIIFRGVSLPDSGTDSFTITKA